MKLKSMIYRTVVRPAVLYGTEHWANDERVRTPRAETN